MLIAPEDGNTLRDLVRSQSWCPVRLRMGGRRSISCRPSGEFKNRPALLSARLHFPVASHLNSSRYHLVLLTQTFPSVFWAAPEKRSNSDWDSFIVYFDWVVGEGAI